MQNNLNYLDRNEFNFEPSEEVKEAVKNFDLKKLCFYTRIYDEGKKSIFSVFLSELYHIDEKQIILGYGAEDLLKQWLNPLYETFIKKETQSSQFDMAEIYDVNFVFIPMIAGFKKMADDFKKGTDKAFWPYIMDTQKTDIKELQKSLGVKDTKIPYFYILNKEGKVIVSESGKFSNQKLEKLEQSIE